MITRSAIRQTLFTQWHVVRILRLVIGIFFMGQAIALRETLTGIIASLLIFQPLTNTGCCGVGSCSIPSTPSDSKKPQDHLVEYEEVTAKEK
jgi:hypothetical protein